MNLFVADSVTTELEILLEKSSILVKVDNTINSIIQPDQKDIETNGSPTEGNESSNELSNECGVKEEECVTPKEPLSPIPQDAIHKSIKKKSKKSGEYLWILLIRLLLSDLLPEAIRVVYIFYLLNHRLN